METGFLQKSGQSAAHIHFRQRQSTSIEFLSSSIVTTPNQDLKMASQWKQDFCNCMGDCEVCLCVSFCSLCQTYQTAEGLNKSGLLYGLLWCIAPCIPTILLRSEAREKYGIEGSTMEDVAAAVCCEPCTQCQTAVEVKERQ